MQNAPRGALTKLAPTGAHTSAKTARGRCLLLSERRETCRNANETRHARVNARTRGTARRFDSRQFVYDCRHETGERPFAASVFGRKRAVSLSLSLSPARSSSLSVCLSLAPPSRGRASIRMRASKNHLRVPTVINHLRKTATKPGVTRLPERPLSDGT